jgi:predicted esterase
VVTATRRTMLAASLGLGLSGGLFAWSIAHAKRGQGDWQIGPARTDQDLAVFIGGSGCSSAWPQSQRFLSGLNGSWSVAVREKPEDRAACEAGNLYPALIEANTEFARTALGRHPNARRRLLIGYSEGGTIAPFIAAALPGQFTHLAIMASGALKGSDEIKLMATRASSPQKAEADLARIIAAPSDTDHTLMGETLAYWHSMLAIEPMQAYKQLSQIPILMVHGDDDQVVPVEGTLFAQRTFRELGLNNLDVRLLPGLGHGLGLASARGQAKMAALLNDWLATDSPSISHQQ